MWLSQQSQKAKYHESICDYLKSAGVNYSIIDLNGETDAGFPFDSARMLLRGVIFQDKEGMIMAVVPQEGLLDVSFLNQQLQRELELAPANRLDQIYLPCQSTSYPPLSEFFGLPAIIDDQINQAQEVAMNTGMDRVYVSLKREAFLKLQNEVWYGKMSIPVTDLINLDQKISQTSGSIKYLTPLRMKQRIKQTFRLPAMPAVAGKILKLRFDPQVTVNNLSQIIKQDPCLSAQLLSWVQSPYHGWRGKVTTIDDAISKILGYDLVVNLTLMTALGQTLHMPLTGPLGLKEYWRTALSTAILVQELVELMPVERRPAQGLAYLAGLLHNLGHFLLAQLFPSYFVLLNQLKSINPQVPVRLIERYAFGIHHDVLGVWLMETWYLPAEIIAAAKYYRSEAYQGEFAVYPHLVLIATQLYANMNDGWDDDLSECTLENLGLTVDDAKLALEKLVAKRHEIATLIGT